jgi:hypothetical protein
MEVIELFYLEEQTPYNALKEHKEFLRRWNALNTQ